MSDKIPYSKVNKTTVPTGTTSVKSSSAKTVTQNGKGSQPRPYSNRQTYLNNYDEIDWGK